MICFLAFIKVKPDSTPEFERICDELFDEINANEPGCALAVYGAGFEPGDYIFTECYRDEAAYALHQSSDHFRRLSPALLACMSERPRIVKTTHPEQ